MTQTPQLTPPDDDMPAEIDFSRGVRGKFFNPGTVLRLPIYLETQVQDTLAALASAKGVEFSALSNDLLKKDIELIQMMR